MIEYDFAENIDFVVFVKSDENPLGDRTKQDHALRDIRKQMEYAGEEYAALNFQEGSYLDKNNQSRPKFNLTEEAFTLIVFSYNTKEAVQTKIKSIQEFKRIMIKHIQESY
ncbi:MAG: Rha family transcriptional regulator [Kurthia sp.]|nr:Rha family transcriptional regulator [Candidatus Kurthia equi]